MPVGSASKANATLAKVFDLVPLDRGSGPSDFAILQQERDLMLGENAVAGALTKAQPGAAVNALFAGLPTGPAAEVVIQPMGFVPHPRLLHVPTAQKITLGIVAPCAAHRRWRRGGSSDDQSRLREAVRSDLRAGSGFLARLDVWMRQDRILVMSGAVETAQTAAACKVGVKTDDGQFATPVAAACLDRGKAGIGEQLALAVTDPAHRGSAMLDTVAPPRVLQLQAMLAKAMPATGPSRTQARHARPMP